VPVWLMILFGALPGCLALFVAATHLGAMRRDVHDLVERAASWDKMKLDVAYLRGRFDGTDDTVRLLQEQAVSPHATRRRPRLKAVSGSGQLG
jgi:hypothetical protein